MTSFPARSLMMVMSITEEERVVANRIVEEENGNGVCVSEDDFIKHAVNLPWELRFTDYLPSR
jgi:hypothetical protein